ncbi:hypothetical protein IWX47DRAFT_284478 [Phyllosticta citricarpa]|uniref:Uncharacterized protein n=1 Tax=Phyllosticta citricarpa TaxID=55181 RepID=A0ABR1M5S8_9PEZI
MKTAVTKGVLLVGPTRNRGTVWVGVCFPVCLNLCCCFQGKGRKWKKYHRVLCSRLLRLARECKVAGVGRPFTYEHMRRLAACKPHGRPVMGFRANITRARLPQSVCMQNPGPAKGIPASFSACCWQLLTGWGLLRSEHHLTISLFSISSMDSSVNADGLQLFCHQIGSQPPHWTEEAYDIFETPMLACVPDRPAVHFGFYSSGRQLEGEDARVRSRSMDQLDADFVFRSPPRISFQIQVWCIVFIVHLSLKLTTRPYSASVFPLSLFACLCDNSLFLSARFLD